MSKHRMIHARRDEPGVQPAPAPTTVDPQTGVVEQIQPAERDAFGAYWGRMTQLDFVKAPIGEVAALYGVPYARSVVARNRRAMVQWAGWLTTLHTALWVGDRPPSVEAWAQEQPEREHYDVTRVLVQRQTDELGGRGVYAEAANAHPHPNH